MSPSPPPGAPRGGPAYPPLPGTDGGVYALLLACLRSRFDEAWKAEVARLSATVDGRRLAAAAGRHRLSPVVAHALRAAGAELPGGPAGALATAAAGSALAGLRQAHALVRVLGLLDEAGIEPLALKGPAMAAALYGDVGLRPSGDLDLLLRDADLLRAKAALLAAGFRPDLVLSPARERAYLRAGFAYAFCDDAHGVEVELHPALTHRAFAFAPDLDAYWRRAGAVVLAGRRVRTPSPEDRVLFLCVHGAKHAWDQLIWVCDVAEALRAYPDLDWGAVRARARASGSTRMLALGLHLARTLAGVTLSPGAAAAAEDPALPGLTRQVWRHMLAPVERKPGLLRQLRFHVGVRERPAERRAQVREKVTDRARGLALHARLLVTPSAADRAFVALPPRWAWLYYLVRPVRVLTGHRGGPGSAWAQARHESEG